MKWHQTIISFNSAQVETYKSQTKPGPGQRLTRQRRIYPALQQKTLHRIIHRILQNGAETISQCHTQKERTATRKDAVSRQFLIFQGFQRFTLWTDGTGLLFLSGRNQHRHQGPGKNIAAQRPGTAQASPPVKGDGNGGTDAGQGRFLYTRGKKQQRGGKQISGPGSEQGKR